MGQAQVSENLGRAWASLCSVDTASETILKINFDGVLIAIGSSLHKFSPKYRIDFKAYYGRIYISLYLQHQNVAYS